MPDKNTIMLQSINKFYLLRMNANQKDLLPSKRSFQKIFSVEQSLQYLCY